MNLIKQLRMISLAAGFVLGIFQPSYADLTLHITTNTGGDTGEIPVATTTFPLDIGGFHFNLTAGEISAPGFVQMNLDGTAGYPYGGNPNPTATISISETGFTAPTGSFTLNTNLTGSFPGAAAATSVLSTSNTPFATTGCSPGAVGPGAIGSVSCSITAGNPYSLTQNLTITLTSGQTANFALTSTVPEPSAMLLFTVGLLGVGLWGRKRFTMKTASKK